MILWGEGLSRETPSVELMPSKNRSSTQARKDRAALKKLRDSGTYTGKIDLRKAPTKYQLSKIKALKGKRKGGAKPKMPPKQKVPGAKITRRAISEKEVRDIPASGGNYTMKTYALPFLRKGQAEPEWRRFTRSQLTKFLAEYKAGDEEGAAEWRSYAIEETWSFPSKTTKSEFKRDTDLYFSGRRIDEPQGGARYQRKTKGHSKAGTKRAARNKRGR